MSETTPAGIRTIEGAETIDMSHLDRLSFDVLDYLGKDDGGNLIAARMDPITIEGVQGHVWAQTSPPEKGERTLAVAFEPRLSVLERETYLWTVGSPRKREAYLGKVSLKSWVKSKIPFTKKERTDFSADELERMQRLINGAQSVTRSQREVSDG